MYNLVDLVQLKLKNKKREEIEEILSAAISVTKESLSTGTDVYWMGLCKFTYKQKAKTKKQQKEFDENPALAEGDKVRLEPLEGLDNLDAKGSVMKITKANGKEK